MKAILFSLFLIALALISCKKDSSSNSTDPSFTWTYNGTSYTADSTLAGIDTIIGGTGQTDITSFRVGNVAVDIQLYAHTTGTYGQGSLYIGFPDRNNLLTSPSVSITRIANGQLDGSFDGFSNGNEVKGSFKNIPFTYF